MELLTAAELTAPDNGVKRWLLRSPRARVAMLTLEQGFIVPTHAHAASDEVFLFVSGRGRLTLDGNEIDVGPGDAVVLKPGEWHGLVVLEGPMHLLAVVAPDVEDTMTQRG